MILISLDIISQSDYVKEEHENSFCSIQFKNLSFTLKHQKASVILFLFYLTIYT